MTQAQNVFFEDFNTTHQTPPFSAITNEQWMPAIERGIANARAEVDAITSNPEAPTFENTIVALNDVGSDLTRVLGVFFPLLSANADDEMMEISIKASALLSDYSTSLTLNEALWKRIRTVYEQRASLNLTTEQSILLQKAYDSFARNGAELEGDAREQYRALSAELSELTTRFGQNVLKEMPTHQIWLTADDLDGLPANLVTAAADAAAAANRPGEYLFTLDQPVYMAFMKSSTRRDLREQYWRTYQSRNRSGEYNNIPVMVRIADLRCQIAKLLGYPDYATYSLHDTMAHTPANVYDLLNRLRDAYYEPMKQELATLSAFASEMEGQEITLAPWDYSYYSTKYKAANYDFDEEALRPYFELSHVVKGVFGLATRLYGLQFTVNDSIEVYHPDVKAYDVTNEAGEFIGVLYTDFFPRPSKRPGAWMTNFSEQFVDNAGVDHRPLVSIVMNFTKPTSETPSLLTPYEVETFMHEFGHALHGLLSRVHYQTLSGTSVLHDFVELPSQFNENFLTEKEFLDSFAFHYITGEAVPEELINKLKAQAQYGAAYACMRQLTFGFLDMAWHTTTAPVEDPIAFENAAIADVQTFEPIEGTMISPTFSHIFSGGYAAGYYGYKWAEVLDADAFSLFRENGIFDRATADSFRTNILERGGSEDPAELYRCFRGRDPQIDALLIRDGIKK